MPRKSEIIEATEGSPAHVRVTDEEGNVIGEVAYPEGSVDIANAQVAALLEDPEVTPENVFLNADEIEKAQKSNNGN